MARTIGEIQQIIIDAVRSNPVLAALTSNSSTALWRLWTFVNAVCVWTLEVLFDKHKTEVSNLIDTLKPHSLKWYAQKAKDFQFGHDLAPDEDFYDNTLLTEDQILASKIIAYSAVVEQTKELRIKVAKIINSDLSPLDDQEMLSFSEYMSRIKDAGVRLLIDSLPADGLKLELDVYYNPLVLNQQGDRIDGTEIDPVGSSIREYLKRLPFNGTFVLEYLKDRLQSVEGVVIPHVLSASAQHGLFPYTSFDVKYNPDSGYLRFLAPVDLKLNFKPQSVIL